MVDTVLKRLSPRFEALYAERGRPSIPPERLLRALLLQVFYSVRSERMLMEQLNYNLLFRWFVGMEMDEPVWNHLAGNDLNQLVNRTNTQAFLAYRSVHEERMPIVYGDMARLFHTLRKSLDRRKGVVRMTASAAVTITLNYLVL